MKIKYKDKDLFDSKSFITFGLGETEICLEDEDGEMKLILCFKEDKTQTKYNTQYDIFNTHEARLTLTNFNSPLGMGFKEPIPLGTLFKRQMYVLLHVFPTGSDPNCKLVNFTVYLGEEVHDA